MPSTAERVVVVADDLTGAVDFCVHALSAPEDVVIVVPWGEPAEERWSQAWQRGPKTLGIDTGSRHLDAAASRARMLRVGEWLTGREPVRLIKKIDSLFRGNPGEEIAALISDRPLVLAPALPEQDRLTREGVQYAHGIPVHESEAANDPHSPPSTSDVTKLVPPSHSVTLFDLDAVRADGLGVRVSIESSSQSALVFDAETREDLARIDRATRILPRAVVVASSGLAHSWSPQVQQVTFPASTPVIVASTSRRIEVSKQLAYLLAARPAKHVRVQPWSAARVELPQGAGSAPTLCVVDADPGTVLAEDAGQRRADSQWLNSAIAERVDIERAAALPDAVVVVIGGDLAATFCERHRVTSLYLSGPAASGAVVCRALAGDHIVVDRLVLRSGGFGDAFALHALLDVDASHTAIPVTDQEEP